VFGERSFHPADQHAFNRERQQRIRRVERARRLHKSFEVSLHENVPVIFDNGNAKP
jgi:hypothetical protein